MLSGKTKDSFEVRDGVTLSLTSLGFLVVTTDAEKRVVVTDTETSEEAYWLLAGKEDPAEARRREVAEAKRRSIEAHQAKMARRAKEEQETAVVKMADGTERRVPLDALVKPTS